MSAKFIPDSEFKPDSHAGNFIPDDKFVPDNQGSAEAQADAAQLKQDEQDAKFKGQSPLAAIEGTAKGLVGPLAELSAKGMRSAASKLGVSEQDLNKVAPTPERMAEREEAFPVTHAAGTITGLMSPVGQGALLEKAGAKLVSGIAEKGILRGMTKGAIKLGAENALFQSGNELSHMIANDPQQSVGSAISNIGLAAALGGVAGGAIGAVSPLWKLASGTKAGEFLSDFKARMKQHLDIPETMPEMTSSVPRANIEPFTKESISGPAMTSPAPRANLDPFTKEPLTVPKPSDMVSLNRPLEETAGGKAADSMIKHVDHVTGSGAAAAVGAAIGHMTGILHMGTIGALVGERTLGPLFKSVIPAIGKRLLESDVSAEGLKAIADYGYAVAKGERLANAAIKNVFTKSDVLPDDKRPSKESRNKINISLEKYQQDPIKIASLGEHVGHYLPDHAVAIGSIASNAINFLNSIKPQNSPRAPLDPKLEPSQAVKAQYDRVLDIAQQPLIVLDSIKNGTLTSHDVTALHTLYPQLYTALRQKVMNQMVEHMSKEEPIPYTTRMGLSMFLQQPLDSTLKPLGIMAAQPMPQQQPQSQQQGQKISQGAASSMNKSAKSSQTPMQASQSMHSTGKA